MISLRNGRPVAAARLSPSGSELKRIDNPWTVRDFCRRSGKSRRQVYRYIALGKVRPLGRFLGEWLLEPSALARIKPPPASLAALLPEFDAASLDLEAARDEISARVLRFGGRDRLRWTFSYYGPPAMRRFVSERGPRLLDARSLRFWCVYFGLPRARIRPECEKGRRWGGA